MVFVIFAIAILVIGGVGIAFNVPVWAAILILLGLLFVVVGLFALKEFLKTEKFKKIITPVLIILVIIFCLFVLIRCSGGVYGGSGSDWEKCMKCGGDGKVVNDYGYNVTCPRCNGVGQIYTGN